MAFQFMNKKNEEKESKTEKLLNRQQSGSEK